METDGLLLRIIRVAADGKLARVADGADLSTAHLSKVERGHRVAPKATVDRIIKAIIAKSGHDFPDEEDQGEPKNIEDYDPAYVLDLARKIHAAVAETVELHRAGRITRQEMAEHCLVLLKCASDLKVALDVAILRRKSQQS
jgi:transcriptional regulator with XRE-family HTH domain